MAGGTRSALVDREAGDPGVVSPWQPRWRVDVGHGCEVGVTVDDGCFVVLYPDEMGQWRPGTHIPVAAACLMKMVNAGV